MKPTGNKASQIQELCSWFKACKKWKQQKKTIKQDLYSQHVGSNVQYYYHSCFCQHDSRISFYAEKMYMHVTISLLNTYTPHIHTSP